jgi:hypothetical protein
VSAQVAVVLLAYAAAFCAMFVGAVWWRNRRRRPVPGLWRVSGRSDLLSPPTITWFVDNPTLMQARGPYATREAAQAACNNLNKGARA